MKMSEVDPVTVREAVQEMDRDFSQRTSGNIRPLHTLMHGSVINIPSINCLVNIYLKYADELHIRNLRPNTGLAKWQKL